MTRAEKERLDRIVSAIATIHRLHNLGDAVYEVRERFGGEDVDGKPYTGNSWEHPKVNAYGRAVSLLQEEGVIK